MKRRSRGKSYIVNSMLLVVVVIWLLPILWILLTSLKTRSEILAPTPVFIFRPSLDSYSGVLGDPGFWRALANSVVYALVGGGLGVIISIPASYVLVRSRIRFRTVIAFGILWIRMMPAVAILLPFYALYRGMGLLDTHLGMLIVHVGGSIPIAVWLLSGFIEELPPEIEDAALVDGCTYISMMRHIVIPLLLPGIAATAIFVFIFAWNDFIFAAFLTTGVAKSVPAFMSASYLSLGETEWANIASASTIYSAPLVLVFMYLHRHLVKGMTGGAIK